MTLEGREAFSLQVLEDHLSRHLVKNAAQAWVLSFCGEKGPPIGLWYRFPQTGLED